MKATIELNSRQLAEAVEFWLEAKNLRPIIGQVRFNASPTETSFGQLTGGHTISATADIVIDDAVAQQS